MNVSRPLRARTPRGDAAYTWFAIVLVAIAFLVLGLTIGLAHAETRELEGSLPPISEGVKP